MPITQADGPITPIQTHLPQRVTDPARKEAFPSRHTLGTRLMNVRPITSKVDSLKQTLIGCLPCGKQQGILTSPVARSRPDCKTVEAMGRVGKK